MSNVPTLEELEAQVADQNEALRACEELASSISSDVRLDPSDLAAFDELTEPVRTTASPMILNGLRA